MLDQRRQPEARSRRSRPSRSRSSADPATCGSVFDPVGIRTFTAPCDVARAALARRPISYELVPAPAGSPAKVTVNGKEAPIDADRRRQHRAASPMRRRRPAIRGRRSRRSSRSTASSARSATPQALKVIGILTILVLYVTMVYGPIAAALVEFFPTRIRYTAMSLPYHIGNGWFGGFLPPTAFAMVAATGDIYYGLWYPIVIALMTFVIGLLFVPETKDRDIFTYEGRGGAHRRPAPSAKREAPPRRRGFFVAEPDAPVSSRWSPGGRSSPRPPPRAACGVAGTRPPPRAGSSTAGVLRILDGRR